LTNLNPYSGLKLYLQLAVENAFEIIDQMSSTTDARNRLTIFGVNRIAQLVQFAVRVVAYHMLFIEHHVAVGAMSVEHVTRIPAQPLVPHLGRKIEHPSNVLRG